MSNKQAMPSQSERMEIEESNVYWESRVSEQRIDPYEVSRRVSGIDIQQSATFTIDNAVLRVFAQHPLINAICWDYFCAGYQTEDIIKLSVYSSPGNSIIARRFVTPDDAKRVFWKLYRTWFTPSHSQVTSWKVDITPREANPRRLRGYRGGYIHHDRGDSRRDDGRVPTERGGAAGGFRRRFVR